MKKLIATYDQYCHYDIWEAEHTLRIYEDRSILTTPCRKYEGADTNSWSLGHKKIRITGKIHAALLESVRRGDTNDEIMDCLLLARMDHLF